MAEWKRVAEGRSDEEMKLQGKWFEIIREALSDLTAPVGEPLPDVRTAVQRRLANEQCVLLARIRDARELQDRERALDIVNHRLRQVVRDAEDQNHKEALATALTELACNRRHAGELRLAIDLGVRARNIADRLSNGADARIRATLELAKSRAALRQDPVDEIAFLVDMMPFAKATSIARIEDFLARIARRAGEYDRAISHFEQALSKLESTSEDAYLKSRVLLRIGFIERLLGRLDIAECHLNDALKLARRRGFRRNEAYGLLDLGQIAREKEEPDAESMLLGALTIFMEIGDEGGAAHASGALASILRLKGSFSEAESLNRRALAIYESCGYLPGVALTRRRLGQCLRDSGRHDEARTELRRAMTLYKTLHHCEGEALAIAAYAKLVRGLDGAKAALPLALRAVRLLNKRRGRLSQGSDRSDFSRLYSRVYSLAFLCSAEAGDAPAAVEIASVVRADAFGVGVRRCLATGSEPLHEIISQIINCELALSPSPDDPIPPPEAPEILRERLNTLFVELRGESRRVAAALGTRHRSPINRPSDAHRLTVSPHLSVSRLAERP